MSNVYAAPAADMASPLAQSQTYLPSMFQLKGRIGRVRYLVYASVLSIIMTLVIGVVVSVLAATANFMMVLGVAALLWIPMFVILFMVLRRRLHDMGKSGWYGLLQLIPLVNLIFILWVLFGRGNQGSNEYGLAPAPNTRPLVIFAWLLPLAMLAATPSYIKFQDQLTKKALGGGSGAADFQKQMEAATEAAAAEGDKVQGVGNEVGAEAGAEAGKEETAPAEPKAPN